MRFCCFVTWYNLLFMLTIFERHKKNLMISSTWTLARDNEQPVSLNVCRFLAVYDSNQLQGQTHSTDDNSSSNILGIPRNLWSITFYYPVRKRATLVLQMNEVHGIQPIA